MLKANIYYREDGARYDYTSDMGSIRLFLSHIPNGQRCLLARFRQFAQDGSVYNKARLKPKGST